MPERMAVMRHGLNARVLFCLSCYGLIAFGIWLRIDYIFQFNPIHQLWSDPLRHWEHGIKPLASDPMALMDPILYQLYVGMLAKLTLKLPVLVGFYTVLLACCTPWIWYRFARELQPSKAIALGLWAALSILPSWICIYGYFMQETLLLPLLGAALWATWRCRRKQDLGSFLLMVLLWALAGLTRGIAIPLAAIACSVLWLWQPQKLQKALYSVLLLGLLLGPLSYRSQHFMHELAPYGSGQLVKLYTESGKRKIRLFFQRDGAQWWYWFVSPIADERPLAPLSDWHSARQGEVVVHINMNKGAQDWGQALATQPLNLHKYLWLTGENLIFLFFGSSWPDSNLNRTLDQWNYWSRWLWAPLTLVVLVGSATLWRRLKQRRMLCTLLLCWIVVQGLLLISVNEGRYRKPGEGLLLAQAALLISVLRRRGNANQPHAGVDVQPTGKP